MTTVRKTITGKLLGIVLGAAVGTLAAVTFVNLVDTAATTPPPVPLTDPMSQDYDTMRMAVEYGCSADGLGDVIPGGAIVWRDGGPVHTSFDEGWTVHEAGEGGVLLAVCER